MNYRPFGKTNVSISPLGFGCMRLPVIEGDMNRIDEPAAQHLVRHAIDQGVNYIDTAYGYHGGNSEKAVGRFLADGYRQKVNLATKMPTWLIQTQEDMDRYLTEQLERLQTDHIDFYLLHALNRYRWPLLDKLGIAEWAQKARASGRIRFFGFSFHDEFRIFKQILDEYDGWDFCQIQYNYIDIEEQAGTRGLKYAAEKGLGVVVMEPLLGGRLATPPESVQAIWDTAPQPRKPADWALQWLWSQPEVSVVLSGMNSMQQVTENLASAANSRTGLITAEDQALISKVRDTYRKICPIPCTHCDYCMPCPNEVNIPRNFELFNKAVMVSDFGPGRMRYFQMLEPERASHCVQCRECESKCPQQIPISDWLVHVREVLGENQPYSDSMRPTPLAP